MYWKWFRDLTKQWITLSKTEYERYKNMYDELAAKEGWYVEKVENNTITYKRIKGFCYSIGPGNMQDHYGRPLI